MKEIKQPLTPQHDDDAWLAALRRALPPAVPPDGSWQRLRTAMSIEPERGARRPWSMLAAAAAGVAVVAVVALAVTVLLPPQRHAHRPDAANVRLPTYAIYNGIDPRVAPPSPISVQNLVCDSQGLCFAWHAAPLSAHTADM